MRFTRIDLSKFGMFTDTTLDLLADGVNVIVGANEAGKTTAMAAIQQLLYGIPLRSEHSYLHQNADLRIGTVVRGNEGTELEFARIKRNAATLRSAADTPLSDDILAALLGGVGAELYQTLFSISHEEIVKGGQELLRSEGELGRALFGAGTGLTQLNSVMAKLDSLAGKLFKSGASKPLINAGLAGYKDLQAQVKELSTSSARVEDLNKAIKKAEANLRGLEDDFGEVSSQLNRDRKSVV